MKEIKSAKKYINDYIGKIEEVVKEGIEKAKLKKEIVELLLLKFLLLHVLDLCLK